MIQLGSLGKVREQEYDLVPQGEKVFTLVDLVQDVGKYGDCLKWIFEIAETDNPDQPLLKRNGDVVQLWQFSDVDIVLGSRQHEWAQILSGRTLEKNDAPPEDRDLIGKRMLAYLTHASPRNDKNAPKKERIVEGSAQPYRGAPSANGHAATPAPAPEMGSVDAAILTELEPLSAQELKGRWDMAKVDAARIGIPIPIVPQGTNTSGMKRIVAELETALKAQLAPAGAAADELPWND